MSSMGKLNLLQMEHFAEDAFRVKRSYIDVTGDLISGILLGQIVYWSLPNSDGKSKLRVKKEGHLWLVKERTDWFNEIRITPKQYDRAIKILVAKEFVETKVFRFDNQTKIHIRLIIENVQLAVIRHLTDGEITELPKGEIRNSPLGKSGIDERVNPLTEITSENTSEKREGTEILNPHDDLQNIIQFAEKNGFGMITPFIVEELQYMIQDYDAELIKEAFKVSVENNVRKINYVKRVLGNWSTSGIKTIQQLKANDSSRALQRPHNVQRGSVTGFDELRNKLKAEG